MRKLSFIFIAVFITNIAMAGGIITNTNQSVEYVRMQARDATLGIDATYFNPAGLTLLPNDGFYLSLNNQTLGQTRTIKSDYVNLNEGTYKGDISAPFFPGIYAVYKIGKFAVSAGFNPIGGGGGGTYETGLPSFEYSVADLIPFLGLAGLDIDGYTMDAFFEGSSVFFGYQLNGSYKISDMISVGLGLRYVSAKEKYKGYLRSIMLNIGGTPTPAPLVFTDIASQYTAGAEAFTAGADQLQPIIDANYGDLTVAEAEGAGIISETDAAQIEAGLTQAGVEDPANTTINDAQTTFTTSADEYAANAATATATSAILQDQNAEYEKTASGFTPIISINIRPSEKWNIALKYEHKTKLEFTNSTTSDFTVGFDPETGQPITMFPDGEKSNLDIPSQIVAGLTYQPGEAWLLSGGFHYYMDKQANWDGREELLDHNSWELAVGAEYKINEKWLVSLGYLKTQSGATEEYQTDLSFSLPSNTLSGGLAFNITHMIQLNLAAQYTIYQEGEKNFNRPMTGTGINISTRETYKKPIWIAAIGLNFNFGAEKE